MVSMRPVELIEDGDPPSHDPAAERADDAPRPRLRPRRWMLLPLAVVLAAVATQQGITAHARHVEHRYDDVPGIAAALGPELRDVWTKTNDTTSWSFRPVGHHIVGVQHGDDGDARAVSLDLDTGRTTWRTPLDTTDPIGQCTPVTSADGAVPEQVACLTWDTGPAAHQGLLTVLAADTGRPARTVQVDDADSFDAGRGLAVLAKGLRYGRAEVRAISLLTGDVVWTATTPSSGQLHAPDDTSIGAGTVIVGDEVLVIDPDGQVTRYRLADGAPLGPGAGQLSAASLPPDGSRGSVTVVNSSGGERSTTFITGTGHDLTLPGVDRTGTVADRGGRDLLLTQDGTDVAPGPLHAYDARTGASLWTAPTVLAAGAVILDGVVYGQTSDGLVALDAHDGHQRWATRIVNNNFGLLADPTHLLVMQDDGTPSQLVAVSRRDGHVDWSVPLPEHAGSFLLTVDHALLSLEQQTARIG